MAVQRRPAKGTDSRGKVSWVVRWYEDGKQKSRSFSTRSEATTFDAEVTQLKARGQAAYIASKLTVGELFDMWATRDTITRESTRESYKHTKGDLYPLEKRHVTKITPMDIECWYKTLTEEGRSWRGGSVLAPRTAKEHIMRLSSAYNWGQKRDLVGKNPCVLADIPGLSKTHTSGGVCPWSRNQFLILARQLEVGGHQYKTEPKSKVRQTADPNIRCAILVHLALGTGARISELLGLIWSDVDLDCLTVTISRQIGRGGVYAELKTPNAYRTIPITEDLATILRDYRYTSKFNKDDDPVIPTVSGKPSRPITMASHIRHAADYLGFHGMHLHECRHLYASTLISKGAPITTISLLLGHSKPSITLDIYSHALQGHTDSARAFLE